MKLLWISNHPDRPSGYGSQTRQVGRRLLSEGIDVEFSANDGSSSGEWMGAKVHGSTMDRYSRDIIRADLAQIRPDWTIVLYDAWVYTEGMRDPFEGVPNVAGWVPVDHNPVSPAILPWVSQHTAIAMDEYGRDQLRIAADRLTRSGAVKQPSPVLHAPHAIDDAFMPREMLPSTGAPFRVNAGIPDDAYLVGIVAANTGTLIYDRKGWSNMAVALAAVQRKRSDLWVYIHSLNRGPEGIDLMQMFERAGCDLRRFVIEDEYAMKRHLYTDADMAGIYSSFDVLLSTSRGEGCGLAPWEAMACGVPVIVSNWTAQAEVVGPAYDPERSQTEKFAAGWRIHVQPDWDARQGAWFGFPLVDETAGAIDDMYDHRGDEAMRQAALARAATRRADHVFDTYWRPILADMEARSSDATRRITRAQAKRERKAAKARAIA